MADEVINASTTPANQPDKRRFTPTTLTWPIIALVLLLAFNAIFTKGFFHIEMRDGHLYGVPVDILKNGAQVMLLALGMSLVIATGGVDLSVGAVMAISGAIAAVLINHPGTSLFAALLVAIVCGVLLGLWNGILVGFFKLQPIVATLVLMVAGRGIAQLVTGGQIVTFSKGPEIDKFVFVGNGFFLGLPFPVTIALVMFGLTVLLTRKTAVGLFIESVGDNETASRFAGLNPGQIKLLTYIFSGLCAAIAGIIATANIKAADANNAGLNLELDAILAAVVGGTALTGGRFSLVGAMIGALLIQTLTTTMYMQDVRPEVAPFPKSLVIVAVCLLQSEIFRAQVANLFARRTNEEA